MLKIDPIIAVKDVEESARWYEHILGLKNSHGGANFGVLRSQDNEVVLCLHKWQEHHHPSLSDEAIPAGNGLLLYIRTHDMKLIRENARSAAWKIEEEIHLNMNTGRKEFSLRDPDGYYLTISAFHEYEG